MEPEETVDPGIEDSSVLLKARFFGRASAWTEYLCLEQDGHEIKLQRMGYEPLAELADYEVVDEDGNVEYRIPEEINGEPVEGIDGEYVMGGVFMLCDDESEFVVEPDALEDAYDWLRQHEWTGEPGFAEAWKKICTAVGREHEGTLY